MRGRSSAREVAHSRGIGRALASRAEIRQMSREPPSEPDEMTLIAMNWTGGTTKWLKLMGAPDTYMLVGEDP